MPLTTLPRQVFKMQYQLVRRPWDFVEQRVAARYPEEAPVRLVIGRWLGNIDAVAGRVFGDEQLRGDGAARRERAKELREAAAFARDARRRRNRAEQHLAETRQEAERERMEARRDAVSAAEDAVEEEAQNKREAAQHAHERAEAENAAAGHRANTRLRAVSEASRAEQERIGSHERRETEEAQGKLRSAQDRAPRRQRLGGSR